jgi:hypothetical protein
MRDAFPAPVETLLRVPEKITGVAYILMSRG